MANSALNFRNLNNNLRQTERVEAKSQHHKGLTMTDHQKDKRFLSFARDGL